MKITRRFTKAGTDVYSTFKWDRRTSRIMHTDGTVVFEMKDAEIPAEWSQLATDIVVSKYFRKAGVPQVNADGSPVLDEQGKQKTGPERSVRQVVHRLAGCWMHWGKQYGYFNTEEDASAFYDEMAHMLLSQMAAPNSPQWFNTGLNYAYGLTGPSQGHWHVNPATGQLEQTKDAYTHPQPHACFIQSVDDDLVNEGGIMDLWTREARLFKYGSGTGTNFSKVRGENESLSGGGKSSGLMSFLKIGDRAAGAIKSGGTTRRAAKMVCLDLDHPDIEEFINWKVREEIKVACLVEGLKHLPKEQQEIARQMKLKLDYDFNGESYLTVSGQNSNNSVRVSNRFIKAVETDGDWQTTRRKDGKVHKTMKARDLWKQIGYAAWRCADPGVQYDDIINDWHTCPQSGRINASNPCVTGDTLVATSAGFRRIVDLVEGYSEIVNGDGDIVPIEPAFKTGKKAVYLLRTQSGYTLRLTADHRVKTKRRGDVAASELRRGDELELRGAGFGDELLDEAVAEELGRLLATGMRSTLSSEIEEAVQDALKKYSQGSLEFLTLSSAFFELAESSQLAVLKGMFGSGREIWGVGEQFARQLQLVLLSFGAKSAIRTAYEGSVNESYRYRMVRLEKTAVLERREVKVLAALQYADSVPASPSPIFDEFLSIESAGVEDVYDLTEPVSHHFVANGIVVHNCSEYMFLDNTACNLASINLMKLYDEESQRFDIDGFKHACRLWTMVLEISVLMAAYPSREIARLSYEFRTLGLGYANLGTLLMVSGIPYDSDAGRAVSGAISSLMTGESYATSAEMAKELGAFPGYRKNRNDMLRVMRNHRAAAYNDDAAYEHLTVKPKGISAQEFGTRQPASVNLLQAARECWDRAVALGEQFGFRNAQTTCIAPTGTIGLLMDCDTTGVEPDFALVKFKKLAGGGYFKIANGSIRPALRNLGYTSEQMHDILTYVMGTLSLRGAPHINQDVLKAKGFTDEELAKTEACLPSVFELAFAFSPWSFSAETLQRLGFSKEQWSNPKFNLLRALGFSKKQIREANEYICGTQTIEGAPHLKHEHYAVFDCANKCGPKSKRFIHHMGHIKMMAAAQPFISGAISKTINMPNEVGVGDIAEAYMESWKLSLKAVALYRDGSKLSQPLNTSADDDTADDQEIDDIKAMEGPACKACGDPSPSLAVCETPIAVAAPIEKVVVKIVERPLRRRLPDTRASITHKFDISGHEGYITVGLFEDSTPGEVFITMAKQGSTIGGLMDTIATLISLNLQYGVPLDAIVRKFEHMRFEPAGMTANSDIPFAKSFVDYIVRWMGMQFIAGYRAANAPKREGLDAPAPAPEPEPAPEAAPAPRREFLREAIAGSEAHGTSGHGNGGNGGNGGTAVLVAGRKDLLHESMPANALNQSMTKLMGDAPTCTCGSITVRNGTCYKCLNCGASLGCS